MKWTEFRHPECQMTFHVKNVYEQTNADIHHCPNCGKRGQFIKRGVTEIEGLLVTKDEVNRDYP